MKTAIRIFGGMQDKRQEKKVQHSLLDIVILTVVSVMCGCTDWEQVAEFGRARMEALRGYLELRNGIPSHDTLRRVMGMIDPKALEACYHAWVRSILPSISDDLISFDGKSVRGSGKPGLKPMHLVSAWSMQAGITLAQLKTAEKSNEITAIPDLLDLINIANCTVSIDAIGCQEDIAEKIITKGGAYVLACKDNQRQLHREIREYFDYADENPQDDVQRTRYIQREKNRGRFERRTYELIEDCRMLSRFHDFAGAKSIGRVCSHVELRDGRIREEERRYITSLSGEGAVQRFAQAARKHWGIEDSCHWVLDVTFHEDACRTRDQVAAQNLTVARKLALALAKRVPDEVVEKYSHKQAKYTSLRQRLFLANLYPNFMTEILLATP